MATDNSSDKSSTLVNTVTRFNNFDLETSFWKT